jgi:hypothetical protein
MNQNGNRKKENIKVRKGRGNVLGRDKLNDAKTGGTDNQGENNKLPKKSYQIESHVLRVIFLANL